MIIKYISLNMLIAVSGATLLSASDSGSNPSNRALTAILANNPSNTQNLPREIQTLQDLPLEILEEITQFLDPKSLARLTRTNKHFDKITADARADHLLKYYDENAREALHYGAIRGNRQWAIKPLIRRGANIHATNSHGYNTALSWAIIFKNEHAVTELLNNGVNASYLEYFDICNMKYYNLPTLACAGIFNLASSTAMGRNPTNSASLLVLRSMAMAVVVTFTRTLFLTHPHAN